MSLQTTVVSKNEQVEELQSKLEKKDEIAKELDSQKGILQDGYWINDKFDNTISPITDDCKNFICENNGHPTTCELIFDEREILSFVT